MGERGALRRFGTEAMVAVPVGQVYRLLEMVELYPLWVPHLVDSYGLTAGPLRPGSRFVFHLSILGFRLLLEGVVTEVAPESLIAFRSVAGPSLRGRWRLWPKGESTRVEFAMEFRLPGGPIGTAARLFDVERVLAEQARRAAVAFRALAERAQAPDEALDVPGRDSQAEMNGQDRPKE